MKDTQARGSGPDHATLAGSRKIEAGSQAIAIGFTDQQPSLHAARATFWGWLRALDPCRRLAAVLPHLHLTSNNKFLPVEKALAFMHGLLCDARKLITSERSGSAAREAAVVSTVANPASAGENLPVGRSRSACAGTSSLCLSDILSSESE